MKSLGSLVLLLSVCSTFAAVPLSRVQRKTKLPTIPNRFIVEVDNAAHIPNSRRSIESPHERLYEHLRARDVGFDVNKEYNTNGLFVGAAITLHSPQDVAALEGAPGVKAVRPVRRIERMKPVSQHIVTGPNDPAIPPDSESTHIMTGVDKLHAQGITGKGVKIGIIDTGIDYTHPLLGGAFGPGHKVIGGFDLVGDDYDGTNTPVPDNDPLDQCDGHGTQVAGVIGANPGGDFGISGVAYGASLSSYRVFGCEGFSGDDVLVDALLMGFNDGQDILTMSLGVASGWTESTTGVVASRIADLGKVVTIATGNDGTSGSWYASDPGTGIDVIAVASVDNVVIPLQNAIVGGVQHDPITYFNALPLPVNGTLPVFATSTSITVPDDACDPLPDTTPDLSNKVVLIRRGTCDFTQKLANVAAKGAKVAVIYDNGCGFAGIDVGDFIATLIQAADGEFLVQQFAAGVPVTLTFPQSGGAINFPDPTGGLVSSFSSYGPTDDFFFKPAVAAPGGRILVITPVPLGSFALESGTSLSTPFVAGSAALIFEAKGSTANARGIRSLLESTATRVPSSKSGGDPLQTVAQQGAGLVNVFNAINAETLVTTTELIANDTAHARLVQFFTVQNTGKTAKKYGLTHAPAGTALTIQAGTIFPADGPVPLSSAHAGVTISPSSFTLNPGSSQRVTTTISPPTGEDASTFPVYSGFIEITDGTQNFHVAYIGLVGSLINKQVLDNTDIFFGVQIPLILDGEGNIQDGPTNYTFVDDANIPTLLWRQVFGSPLVLIDLVDPNIQVTTSLKPRAVGQNTPLFTFPNPKVAGTFSQVKTIGSIFEVNFLNRNNEDFATNACYIFSWETPTFANGTTTANGMYRFLLRVLRATGDPQKEEDYDVYLSPIVGVNA